MSAEHIDELFDRTLLGDYDDDAPWEDVNELRRVGSREVFDKAAAWCASRDPLVRARGLDILAQIGNTAEHPGNAFPEEAYSIVSGVLRGENEIRPLESAIAALGHLHDPAGIPLIVRHRSHPNSGVRFSVACALGSYSNDYRSAEALLELMKDSGEEVRDWATFGLGVLGELDSVEIRDALVERLSDSNEDVRQEAIAGLGKRRDNRVLSSLVAALDRPGVADPVVESACYMLDLPTNPEGWKPDDYASALRKRFTSTALLR
jgi:hypothetical protein